MRQRCSRMTGGRATSSSRKLSAQVMATRMPTQVSVRSSSRLSRSRMAATSGAPGAARCAATAWTPLLSTANMAAQPTAVSTTVGRVSQASGPASETRTAPGTVRWKVAEIAAPASPSAAELNARRYTGVGRTRRNNTAPMTSGASIAYRGGSSSAMGSHHAESRSRDIPDGWPSLRIASMQITAAPSSAANRITSAACSGVMASCQPISPRSQATTVSTYATNRAGIRSSGQRDARSGGRPPTAVSLGDHRASRCRPCWRYLTASCTADMPLPIMCQADPDHNPGAGHHVR